MEWLLATLTTAGTAFVADHTAGRDANWWWGPNSLYGKFTENYDVSITNKNQQQLESAETSGNLVFILALVYFVSK